MPPGEDFRRFEIPDVALFDRGPGGLERLRLKTALADAEILLQGAHLTRFKPSHAEHVLFVSEASHFAPGKPVRGGVPVCFPWFAARAGHPESPSHGFARIKPWRVAALEGSSALGVRVLLELESDDETRALWPCDFVAQLRFEITRQLVMTLEIENRSPISWRFEAALHSYFSVSDVRNVSVTGLEGADYVDKVDASRRHRLAAAPLRIDGETDRLFPGSPSTCTIHDPGAPRQIIVEKSGSDTTVVWNPWIGKAAALEDFGDDEWPGMLCIETANAGENAIELGPGARHSMTATIRLA
ncbi:MAG: glucose-6-phosphate 1-epimerase [Chthoniobacter sp.]|jgi:glucose-6-phosphate 1-epimerase|nr:glucose-6-phosphate 1-epimerase [Chthoniobacter sp.]